MRISESLDRIQRPWMTRVSHQLARGVELRENFEQMLSEFYNRLRQAVETGDPAWLDEVLDQWARSQTETELVTRELSLSVIINQIHMLTFEVARENLSENEALNLSAALLPVFLHAGEFTFHVEMEQNVDHLTMELEKATANLRRLDKTKSDFIAIAAHELKTPLTLIEGYAAMLRDQLPAGGDSLQSTILLKGVDNGTRRLREIVDDMIDVSLIDNNMLSLNFQPVWINRLLTVLSKEFTAVIAERRLRLDIYPFSGWDEMTFGDGERLYQAFRNLFSNAIKFTPDGGRVTIDGRKLPGFLEITFTDSGIGIDPEDHGAIFEKFGRLGNVSLHSSGKTKFKGGGPGLGLPITKGILDAHGGAIWVESAGYDEVKCPGTTFHILLPLRKVPPDDRTARIFKPLIESELQTDKVVLE
jgi:signal transduction histidine kinase